MKKDHFITGFIVGLLWPIMVYGILLTLMDLLDSMDILYKHQLAQDFHTRTLSLVALGCNVFAMQYFNKKKWTNAMRGLIIPTLVMAVIWFIKFKDVLSI